MLALLQQKKKVIGIKQSKKEILEGNARYVFIAQDADPAVIEPFEKLCGEKKLEIEYVSTMKELGQACHIDVGAAIAVLID